MKTPLGWTWIAIVAMAGRSGAPAQTQEARASASRSALVGAWRLASLDEPGADGTMRHVTDARGSLIYTPDGHMSVQVMFAKAEAASSTSPVTYAQGGYEGSFGRYDVNEAAQTVTHHVQGANVRTLVGQDLPRSYRISDGRLVIRSTRPDEHWSVTWEHD